MNTCQICGSAISHTNPPSIYCDSVTCTKLRYHKRNCKRYYMDKERKVGGSRLIDLAWMRLILRTIQICKQDEPCNECRVEHFCTRRAM